MKILSNISSIALSVIGIAKCSTATPFLSNVAAASSTTTDSVFGIARGGGIFSGGNKKKDSVADVEDKLKAESGETFPALSQEEIEEWLGHIPVFAVTDSNGAGVVLKPDNDTSVMYFFFSPQMANATLAQLKGTNDELDLKLSAFSLGKIWFKMLSNEEQEIKLKQPGAADSEAEVLAGGNVEYRLVPDTRDLLGARMLLTMTPEDGEEMKKAGDSMTPELAQKAVEKAMTESPEFKENYNEVPIFLIAQMRMQKPASEEGEEVKTILPMYFSLQSMVATWQQFMASQNDPGLKDMEPAINVMNLHKLVEMMKEPSEIDFRSCLLLPPIPAGAAGGGAGAPSAGMGGQVGAPEAQMAGMGGGGGGTLGDI
mmetsp:Transcript_54086/g.114883  ORF Transcript_54086/g.114883 Transcript_54086/m.114883 type:complete len:371 (-) Transcript_54086:63-1175(-)|eukprot:CAMPEP_0172526250 /NCGR_PEP_ID=MMETSP1067-20121228/1195_1 /TAXON_ID=265564 ORGANISM="Thalassiosira punctigera, Strain Tpunct2005C2" /NCGR_SAMPLE_ID=MMETSP1067 /ASSEMBLY_ACC=CAM_ASM_000444 /LENGTH=370 /DNA_ID=CAMNT_0013309717 /DNA_START=168 /DNA_END=1280 /DNA_ORIENTATION=-